MALVVEEDGLFGRLFFFFVLLLWWWEPVAMQLAQWWLAWRQVKVESDLLR